MLKLPSTTASYSPVAASFDESGSSSKPPDDSTGVAHNTALSSESQTTFSSGSTTDFGSYPQISKESFGLHSTFMDSPSLNHALPQQYLQKVGTNTASSDDRGHSHIMVSSMTRESMGDDNRRDVLGSANLKFAYTASTVVPEPGYPTVEDAPSSRAVGSNGNTVYYSGAQQKLMIVVFQYITHTRILSVDQNYKK